MAKITHLNYSTTLKQSDNPRGSSPNGNIYYHRTDPPEWELITADELATVDFGEGPVANPFVAADGITMRALYRFLEQERRVDETLRFYKMWMKPDYSHAGAYNAINDMVIASADLWKVRGSGSIFYAERSDKQIIDISRKYHGVRSLNTIQATTQSYYAFVTATDEASLQAATWYNFSRLGAIDEMVQVLGDTSYGDSGAGDFDHTAKILIIRCRSWQYICGETTSVAAGIGELSGFSSGYGIGETPNTQNTYDLADVYGGSAIAPFTGLSLHKLATPKLCTGFNEADGYATWVLYNTLGASLSQCTAFLDALALQDAVIDSEPGGTYNGRKGRVWYTRDSDGRVVTASIGGAGLDIEGLSGTDKRRYTPTLDDGLVRTFPSYPEVQIEIGAAAVADPLAWFQVMNLADYDTGSAEIVTDFESTPVYGDVATSDFISGTKIQFSKQYPGYDVDMVVVVEGDGGCAQALQTFTFRDAELIEVSCEPSTDQYA